MARDRIVPVPPLQQPGRSVRHVDLTVVSPSEATTPERVKKL